MDLKFNSQAIVAERERRAWSQQHLADAAGLALRTIQRIETRGTGSYESLRALAACLEIPATALRVDTEDPKPSIVSRSKSARIAGPIAGASVIAGILGSLWLGAASAKEVLVDVAMTVERNFVVEDPRTGQDLAAKDTQELKSKILARNGKRKEQYLGDFNLILTPTILKDGRIALSARLYQKRDAGFEVLAAPELIVADGNEAKIEFSTGTSASGDYQQTYRVTFQPKIQ